jgi:hypothetical protein
MTFTYNLSTDIGKVRLLIPDREIDSPLFQDDEITAFLTIEDGVQRAAALALETIASDQVMTLKVMRLLDMTTDGQKVSQALLERSGKLREQADQADADEEGGLFDVAEMVVDVFTERERILKQAIING